MPAEVEVSYHVGGASWRPLYDLTLEGERLAVSYLAEVTQQTGEDWPAVELVLSTTRRGRHQGLPELDPWYVRRAQPPAAPRAIRARAAMAAGSGGPVPPPMLPPQMAAPGGPPPEAAMLSAEPVDAGRRPGLGVAYRVQRPLAVPADGGPQKTSIARFDLDATLDHLTVPVLAPEAYLRATATNTSSLLLLPGPARVFHGSQFTGETALETVAAGEEHRGPHPAGTWPAPARPRPARHRHTGSRSRQREEPATKPGTTPGQPTGMCTKFRR